MCRHIWKVLDLPFYVDFLECRSSVILKEIFGLTGKEAKAIILFLEEMLALVIANELGGVGVGFESKLLSNES